MGRTIRMWRAPRACAWASLILAAGAALGTGKAAADTPEFTVVRSFSGEDGSYPGGRLALGDNGYLYGTTEHQLTCCDHGTAFRLGPDGTFTTLHVFEASDGAVPTGALIKADDGNFYGTTAFGGADWHEENGSGVVFRLSPDGAVTVVHSFSKAEGQRPYRLTLGRNGWIYGVTGHSGPHSGGTIFRLATDGSFQILHSFNGEQRQAGGAYPTGVVEGSDGGLYGTTASGGLHDRGTVFRLAPDGQFSVLHHFEVTEGWMPRGTLTEAADGYFYGVTGCGGNEEGHDHGALFRIAPGGAFEVLHRFHGTDGEEPADGLVKGRDGRLYGTTVRGGTHAAGTIYSIDTFGAFNLLFSFPWAEGRYPLVGPVETAPGVLYGTTSGGGATENGTIFRFAEQPAPVLSTSAIAFGQQAPGTTSAARSLIVSNAGSVDFRFTQVSVSGDYGIVGNTCIGDLQPGAACTIDIAFTPQDLGPREGDLLVQTNFSSLPLRVTLSGSGAIARIVVLPDSIDFGNQRLHSENARIFTVLNDDVPVNLGTPYFSGPASGDFSIRDNDCPAVLGARKSCAITISFRPSALGEREAGLRIPSDADSGDEYGHLSGIGTAPIISVTPAALDFGKQAVNKASAVQNLGIANIGNESLLLGPLFFGGVQHGDFTIQANNCPSSIAAGASCTLGVSFRPSYTGSRNANLSIPSSAINGTQSAAMSGTGRGLCAPEAVVVDSKPVCIGY